MNTRVLVICIALSVLAVSRPVQADSILVGSNISSPITTGVLCPSAADCLIRAQQFTLLEPVVIDDINIVLTDGVSFGPNGAFTVGLGTAPIDNTGIASGNLTVVPNSGTKHLLDFGGLDIALGPGTYYLGVTGDNLSWDNAAALATSAGTLGNALDCDPTVNNCSNLSMWDIDTQGPYSMQISGSTGVPEPSCWILLATGLAGTVAAIRRRCFCAR